MQIQSANYSDSSSQHSSGSNCTAKASGHHLAMAEGVTNNDPKLRDASSSRVAAATAASASAAADSGLPSSPIDLSVQQDRVRYSSLPDQSSADDVEIDVEYADDDEDANQDWSLDIEKSSSLKQQSAKFEYVESALEGDPLARFMIVCNDQNVKWRKLINRHRDHQPPNRCGECQKDFRCRSALMMHYRTHTDERPYLCGICQKSFATKGNLKTHLSVHREAQQLLNSSSRSSETMPPTPILPPVPASQPAAMLSKPAIKATSFFSDDAPSRMLDRLMSSEYAKCLHPLSSLPMQQQQLQPPQSEPLELTKSSKNGTNNTSNTIVLINHHQTSRSAAAAAAITCELCGKACSCRSALEIHMRTHTKEKPFLCGQCGKGFSTKGNMRQHELTHRRNIRQPDLDDSSRWSPPVQQSQPPPPQPPQLSFQQSSSLVPDDAAGAATSTPVAPSSTQQSQQKSAGHRSRVCEHCNKECPTRSALDIHRRSHTGEKPYRCPGCAKRFSTHGNMQAHVRRHCPQTRATVAAQQSPKPPPPLPSHFLLPQAQPPPPPPHHHHMLYSLAAAAALRGASSLPTQPHVSPPPGFFLPPFAFGGPSSFLPGAANVASFGGEFQLSSSLAGSRV